MGHGGKLVEILHNVWFMSSRLENYVRKDVEVGSRRKDAELGHAVVVISDSDPLVSFPAFGVEKRWWFAG